MPKDEDRKRVKYLEDAIELRLGVILASVAFLFLTFLGIALRLFKFDLSFFRDIRYFDIVWLVNEIPLPAVSLFALVWLIVIISCLFSLKKYKRDLKSLVGKSGVDKKIDLDNI